MAVNEYCFRAMASAVQVIVVDGPVDAGVVARRVLGELESLWSRFIETSDISRLNCDSGLPVEVATSTTTLLEKMCEAWRMTGGLFDPSILPDLVEAGYVASIDDQAILGCLPETIDVGIGRGSSFQQVSIDDRFVTLPRGMAIDAGGIGKGLAADLVVSELLSLGVGGALVSVGGDLFAGGQAPEDHGWRVDVENPFESNGTLCQLSMSGGGAATSSTRSRRWRQNGTDQHHVIDPATKTPSRSDLVAVTVIASSCWQAEAHATALLLGGRANFNEYTASQQIHSIAFATDRTMITTDSCSEFSSTESASL
jgi:FAD:protein FMN transferase